MIIVGSLADSRFDEVSEHTLKQFKNNSSLRSMIDKVVRPSSLERLRKALGLPNWGRKNRKNDVEPDSAPGTLLLNVIIDDW